MSQLRNAQLRGVMRLELRKSLLGRRALPIYGVGALPVIPVTLFILVSSLLGTPDEFRAPGGAALFFIALFQFILRFVVYFGCVWVFMNLFRGEVLDRSLHYYLLTPIRRELLVAGKYLAAWITSTLVFGGSTLLCFVAIHAFLGSGGPGSAFGPATIALLARYLAVVALGCLGYGAVFLFVGLFLRSLIVPALVIFLVENANTFLPAALKKISVIYYLQGLMPLPPAGGPVHILAEPVSVWIAVPGLLLFTAATLVASGLRIRSLEVSYASD